MPDVTGCAAAPTTVDRCPRCDLLLGLEAVHVEAVDPLVRELAALGALIRVPVGSCGTRRRGGAVRGA